MSDREHAKAEYGQAGKQNGLADALNGAVLVARAEHEEVGHGRARGARSEEVCRSEVAVAVEARTGGSRAVVGDADCVEVRQQVRRDCTNKR